jgi:GT2 family glycosyltransferase
VEAAEIKGNYRIRRRIQDFQRVSIVIVSRDRAALTQCLQGIEKTADSLQVEIVVVSDAPLGLEVPDTQMPLRPCFVPMGPPGAGRAAAFNRGAAAATGEQLLFLDEGLAAGEAGWLEPMVEQIQREAIGVVGGKILRQDGTIVSAGLVLNGNDVAAAAFANFRDDNVPYFGHHHVVRNCSAVPATCLMVRKRVFDGVGGFDERRLPTHFFAVDLCLRVREEGRRVLYTPHAAFVFRGSPMKRMTGARQRWDECDWVAEKRYMKERWGKSLVRDPYCNPNLTADGRFNIRAAAS